MLMRKIYQCFTQIVKTRDQKAKTLQQMFQPELPKVTEITEKDAKYKYVEDYTKFQTKMKFSEVDPLTKTITAKITHEGQEIMYKTNTKTTIDMKYNPLALQAMTESQVAIDNVDVTTIKTNIIGKEFRQADLGSVFVMPVNTIHISEVDVNNIPENKNIQIDREEKVLYAFEPKTNEVAYSKNLSLNQTIIEDFTFQQKISLQNRTTLCLLESNTSNQRICALAANIFYHVLFPRLGENYILYVNLSAKILRGEQIHREKKDANECVYQEFFQNNKKLFNQLQKPTNVHYDNSGAQLNAKDFKSLPKTVKQEQPLNNQFFVKTQQQPVQQQQKQQPQVQETKQQKKQKNQPQGKWQASGQAILQNQAAIEKSFPVLDFQKSAPETKKPVTTGPFQMDESFILRTTYQPVKSIEGTEWDSNPIIPKKNQQLKEVAKIQKKNKTIIQISGGFQVSRKYP